MSAKKRGLLIRVAVTTLVMGILIGLFFFILRGKDYLILDPKGIIAEKQRNLFVWTVAIGLIAVLIIFVLTAFIAIKYRASNKKSDYKPEWDSNRFIEGIWWALPFLLIGSLAIVTWFSSHDLDPFKPIGSDKQTKTIQVVAMQWKWLFIYPEEKIVSINYAAIPEDVPVKFEITADAPMNSFWVPQLGGQMYAMSGMSTELNLLADEVGQYKGVSSNISGAGFASMNFIIDSKNDSDYDSWIKSVYNSNNYFSFEDYQDLTVPSESDEPLQLILSDHNLYNQILAKYTTPGNYVAPEEYHTDENHELTEGTSHD
ncbi:MAG: cytochrome ubiquinol oxidase subunit II [Candidatus Saccharibacteria bacterium]|nr:cytochrome ubiquinol oxidase subunit II [Candidatus Saccharibacteria bacterium]